MGYGSYTSSDWDNLRKDRGISNNSNLHDLYTSTSLNPLYDPAKVTVRESRDSKDNPVSTPIIIGLDVTGSMGYLSTEIAKTHLNKTIMELYDKKPVLGPQILFAAIDDSKEYNAACPLQVTQFESDIRIAKQLLDLWFVGHGYGNGGESYNLLWWFALHHTVTDCNEKRNGKGIMFTIGDEPCHRDLTAREISCVFNDSVQSSISSRELYKQVSKKYDTYHICLSSGYTVDSWENIMPGHVIPLSRYNISYLSDVITAVIRINSGEKKQDVINSYGNAQAVINDSLKNLKK